VAAYYPNWSKPILPPDKIQFENITHIVHAFAWPTNDGNIEMYLGMPDADLINETHSAGKKILIAFGGWGQCAGFAPTTADSTKRTNFINNLVNLIAQSGIDGIDFDWEYPANSTEGKNFTKLIKELRIRFNQINPTLLITMAVSAGPYGAQFIEFEKIITDIDYVFMMGYDFHGTWTSHSGHNAPLYPPSSGCNDGAVDGGINYLLNTRKIPSKKLAMGVPFYGREFTTSGLYQPQSGVKNHTYTTVEPLLNNSSWEYHWDNISKVSYLQDIAHTKLITFDDTTTIRNKCEYALNKHLAGIMIWALGQDIVANSQPLLETVGKTLNIVTSIYSEKLLAEGYKLYDNYPNPFNPSTTIKFEIKESGFVNLSIYDVLGNKVKTLINEEKQSGIYEVVFLAKDENDLPLSSGIYFYRIETEKFSAAKKLMLIK
jgi:chitinase